MSIVSCVRIAVASVSKLQIGEGGVEEEAASGCTVADAVGVVGVVASKMDRKD